MALGVSCCWTPAFPWRSSVTCNHCGPRFVQPGARARAVPCFTFPTQLFLAEADAQRLHDVLRILAPDWLWDASVNVLTWDTLSAASCSSTSAVVEADGRVRLLSASNAVTLEVASEPPETLTWLAGPLSPALWVTPNLVVRRGGDSAVVLSRDGDRADLQLALSGTRCERVSVASLLPVRPRLGERAMLIHGSQAGAVGVVSTTSARWVVVQVHRDNADHAAVVPWSWVCKQGEAQAQADVEHVAELQRQLMAQRDLLVRQFTPGKEEEPGPVRNARKPVVESTRVTRKARERDEESAVKARASSASDSNAAEVTSLSSSPLAPPVPASPPGSSSRKSSSNNRESLLRFVGKPDDTPVPLRGSPPPWLFENWQGALLVKVHGFPQWPCRVGSTLDLFAHPTASDVPDAQKEVFVYFFGDKTVSWARYAWLKPWPRGADSAAQLATISVGKKHEVLWAAAVHEANEWDALIQAQPLAPPPVEKDAATAVMQPVAVKAAKKRAKTRKSSSSSALLPSSPPPAAALVAPSSTNRPVRSAALPQARQRHLRRALGDDLDDDVVNADVVPSEASAQAGWVDLVACGHCKNAEDDANLLLCDSPFCSAAFHTYCLTPPLEAVPSEQWFCPLHAAVERVYCPVCKGGEHEDLIVLCDAEGCGQGFHMYCLEPALVQVPDDEWLCPQHDGSNGASARSTPGVPPAVLPSSGAPRGGRPRKRQRSKGSGKAGSAGGSTRKQARRPTDPNIPLPKKPKGAFVFWANANREQVKQQHPALNFADLSKMLGSIWMNMNDDDRKPYQQQAEADRERYATAMQHLKASGAFGAPPSEDDDVPPPAPLRNKRKAVPIKLVGKRKQWDVASARFATPPTPADSNEPVDAAAALGDGGMDFRQALLHAPLHASWEALAQHHDAPAEPQEQRVDAADGDAADGGAADGPEPMEL